MVPDLAFGTRLAVISAGSFDNLERIIAMIETPRYSGLCETCDYDATCTLRRSTQLKIVQCEEFSVHSRTSKPAAKDSDPVSDFVEASILGLCVNCLNVATCGFPDARRGVVECEEYILDEAGVVPPVTSERTRSAA